MDQHGRREPNPTCCPLTSTNVLSQVRARVPSDPIVIKQTTTEKTPSQTMYTLLSVRIWILDEVPVEWLWFCGCYSSANQLWKENSTRCQSAAQALGRKSDSHTGTTEEGRNKKNCASLFAFKKKKVAFLLHLRKIRGLNPGVLVEVPEAKY